MFIWRVMVEIGQLPHRAFMSRWIKVWTRLGYFYVTAILSWGYGWGWVEAEVDLSLRLKWGWDEIQWEFSWN